MMVGEELKKRHLLNQSSVENIDAYLRTRPRTVYLGLDPSADSLHVGHLAPILAMRHLSEAGHSLIFLVGGGTGMIGDPSGKSDERNLLDEDTLRKNTNALKKQVKMLVAARNFRLVDNGEWLSRLGLIEFLRDIGKHFTVNSMVKRDAVRPRLETPDQSISFTEFSYLLLQAYDFYHLNIKYKCDLQVGGANQWGNVVSGIELIRRKLNREVAGFTVPLVIDKVSGKKFGKSEGNAIWLDEKKTSPYAFYQFWLNVSDPNVFDYLRIFTFHSVADIEALESQKDSQEKYQQAKISLAYEVTTLVHGKATAEAVQSVSEVLFGDKNPHELSRLEKEMLRRDAPGATLTKLELSSAFLVTDMMVRAKLVSSKTEARTLIESGGVSINGLKVASPHQTLAAGDFAHGFALLRRGKKQFVCLTIGR